MLIFILNDFRFNNKDIKDSIIDIILFFGFLLSIHYIIKDFIKLSYFTLICMTIIIYLSGWIENRLWELIALITVVANMLLNHEDAYLIYVDTKNSLCTDINFYKNRQIHKIKFIYLKLKFNIAIIFLYLYIQLTENINIFGRFFIYDSKENKLTDFMRIFYKGTDKLLCLFIILIVLSLLSKCKRVKEKADELITKLKTRFINAFELIIGYKIS